MSSFSYTDDSKSFDPEGSLFEEFCVKFKKITKDFALFHLLFAAVGAVEVVAFLILFSLIASSPWLAISLALMLLTGFAYIVLRFYFECKKPEQLMRLRDHFLDLCKSCLPFTENSKEFHLRVAEALFLQIHKLEDEEYLYYQLKGPFHTLNGVLKRLSCYLHWKDVFSMKEILMFLAIEEQVQLVQAHPCDVEAHATLAENYMSLSRLYRYPCKAYDKHLLKIAEKLKLWEKFSETAHLALEEFAIIESFSAQNPWVYAQRAALYHDLEQPKEEIKEYEKILAIRPHDDEIIFRLGVLYFSQGSSAKGLSCYQELKEDFPDRAKALISLYDAKFRKISEQSLNAYS